MVAKHKLKYLSQVIVMEIQDISVGAGPGKRGI